MPCYDGRSSGSSSCDCEPYKTEARDATRAGCDMRTILRRHGLEKELCDDTLSWIAIHDKEDEMRIRIENKNGVRERTKRRALCKLNLDERRVLGL